MALALFVRPGRLPSSRSIDLPSRCKPEGRAMKVRLFFLERSAPGGALLIKAINDSSGSAGLTAAYRFPALSIIME